MEKFSFVILFCITFFTAFLNANLFASDQFQRSTVITIDREIHLYKPWLSKSTPEDESIQKLITYLETTATGKIVITAAKKQASLMGQLLSDVIKVGPGSITDTTLTRRFRAHDPSQVVYESKSQVYINGQLNFLDAAMDLAHELTHFTYRKNFNPYIVDFSLGQFIEGTVEGVGGEVDAFLVECQVYAELFPGKIETHSSCGKIFDVSKKALSRNLAVKEFYQMGDSLKEFHKRIAQYKTLTNHSNHPLDKWKFEEKISNEKAFFISSAYGVPYPLAALLEYINIMDKVCHNDHKRYSLMKKQKLNEDLNRRDLSSTSVKWEEEFKGRCGPYLAFAD